MKLATIGTVWTARAYLYDGNFKVLGNCIDTPNAIANAFRELPQAVVVKSLMGLSNRSQYENRIADWNKCPSGLTK